MIMKKIIDNIKRWWHTLFQVWIKEYRLVFSDLGVLLFFIALPLAYPIVYTLIYNPEIVYDVPVAVVDNCRTADSRQFARMIDASPYTKVAGYASDLEEAKTWMKERKVYGIMELPHDYSRKIGRNEQAVVPIYCDMSLLLRYKSILLATTDVSLQLGSDIRTKKIDYSPVALLSTAVGSTVNTESFFLGDVTQGFASFVMIGIVVLILQQSLVLGVLMLGGGSSERRRKNRGIDPEETDGPMSASILGKSLCYLTIYAPLTIYILHYIPVMFSLPHIGNPLDYLTFILPMLLASTFLGQMLRPLVVERESSFLVFVFTSVLFLFLSGLTWPRPAMSDVWFMLSSLVPATWGIEGFIGINSNGATLGEMSTPYLMLWALTIAYYFIAVIIEKWCKHRDLRHYKVPSVP